MIHQNEPGTIPCRLHAHPLTAEVGEEQIGNGRYPHHGAEQPVGADGLFMFRAGQVLHLGPTQFLRFDFHRISPFGRIRGTGNIPHSFISYYK